MIYSGINMKCNIIPFSTHHIEKTFQWIKAYDLRKLFLMRGDADWETHLTYFKRILNDPTQKVYAIMLDEIHVGNCGFKNISLSMNEGELWIYIGNSSMRGKKIGTNVIELLIKDAINVLKLRKIYLHVAEFNIHARNLYKKFNFIEVEQKQGKQWANRECNVIRMELKV